MRPVTPGDILAAARVLLAQPGAEWDGVLAEMLDAATRADRFRLRHGRAHPLHGNGTLMSVATGQASPPPAGDMRFLRAQGAVIAAILARSERLEGHGGERPADTGDVEQRL
ncbi:MAG: hypothetical protein GVY34_07960 [Alphaproteobacteria bacterium]|jgi:hypothetical protein|nr:hypothetical protein [Alphaproteobacteria bacterium]